jgi:hypothetical protein
VLGELPAMAPLRAKEKAQLIPLDQLSRIIADLYQKKVKDDQLSDSKGKLRCSVVRFMRNHLLRQYGMKSMAEKALRELTNTVRAYSHGGACSLVRVRMFGEMTGMLKDAQGVIHLPWVDRKTDFFLFVLARLARCAKEESTGERSTSEPARRSAAEEDRIRNATPRGRRQSVAVVTPRSNSSLPIGATNGSNVNIKEVLCREEVTISFSGVQSVVEAAVPDASAFSELMSRLQPLRIEDHDEPAVVGMLHMDDVLELSMLMWDEQEAVLTPRVDELLQARCSHLAVATPSMPLSRAVLCTARRICFKRRMPMVMEGCPSTRSSAFAWHAPTCTSTITKCSICSTRQYATQRRLVVRRRTRSCPRDLRVSYVSTTCSRFKILAQWLMQ